MKVSNAALTSNMGEPSCESLASVGRLSNQATNFVLASAQVLPRALDARNGAHKLVPNIAGLSVLKRARLTSLLNEFNKLFTTQPGCTKPVWHSIDTSMFVHVSMSVPQKSETSAGETVLCFSATIRIRGWRDSDEEKSCAKQRNEKFHGCTDSKMARIVGKSRENLGVDLQT